MSAPPRRHPRQRRTGRAPSRRSRPLRAPGRRGGAAAGWRRPRARSPRARAAPPRETLTSESWMSRSTLAIAARDLRAHRTSAQHADAHLRRLVVQQQRRNQVPLVQRLQHPDRVECVRVGIESSSTSASTVAGSPTSTGIDSTSSVRVSRLWRNMFRQYVAGRRGCRRDPQHHDADAGVTQLAPVETESPAGSERG